MKAEELIKLGNDIDQLLSSRSLPNKPIFDIVVPYDEFKDLDWRVYYAINRTSDGYEPSENEIVLNYTNCTMHVYYDEETKKKERKKRLPKDKKGFFAFLLRHKVGE